MIWLIVFMAWVSWLMVLQLQSYQVSLAFSIFSGVLEQALLSFLSPLRLKQCPTTAAPKPALGQIQMKPDGCPQEPFFHGMLGGEPPRLWALLPAQSQKENLNSCHKAAVVSSVLPAAKLRA
jgi:hypothetical protein